METPNANELTAAEQRIQRLRDCHRDLRQRLAQILFDRGEGRKAVETLAPVLAVQTLDPAAFSQGYR